MGNVCLRVCVWWGKGSGFQKKDVRTTSHLAVIRMTGRAFLRRARPEKERFDFGHYLLIDKRSAGAFVPARGAWFWRWRTCFYPMTVIQYIPGATALMSVWSPLNPAARPRVFSPGPQPAEPYKQGVCRDSDKGKSQVSQQTFFFLSLPLAPLGDAKMIKRGKDQRILFGK